MIKAGFVLAAVLILAGVGMLVCSNTDGVIVAGVGALTAYAMLALRADARSAQNDKLED